MDSLQQLHNTPEFKRYKPIQRIVYALFLLSGFAMMGIYGLTFDGSRSLNWLLVIGILSVLVSAQGYTAIVSKRLEILELAVQELAEQVQGKATDTEHEGRANT